MTKYFASILACLLLSGCASDEYSGPKTSSPKKATSRPYTINGITYYPQDFYEYKADGVASHYGDGDGFHGKKTATGERFDTNKMTAAHKTLPLPCIIRVTNLENGRCVKLKVNDRGPFPAGRMLDVSRKAAQLLGFYRQGLAKVRVETLVDESLALNNKKSKVDLPRAYAQADIDIADSDVQPPKKKRVVKKAKALPPGLYVHAASFTNANKAKAFSNKMHHLALGAPVKIEKSKKVYAVQYGPFKSGKDAKNLIKHISKAGCKNARVVMK